jgi:hypothetical protein
MESLCAATLCVSALETVCRYIVFSYYRDELGAPAIQPVLAQASAGADGGDNALSTVCRHLGRVIIGWLTAIIVIQLAVNYWGGQP